MRLAIAVPCHVFIAPQMAQSLAGMCLDLGKTDIQVGLRFLGNAVSTFGRNALVRWAKENQADYVLWIDTDQVFPADSARRLMASGLPFIGANYSLKQTGGESVCTDLMGRRLAPKDDGIESVAVMGFGLTLTRMDVLDGVGEPWFATMPANLDGPADEIRFCQKAIQAGFQPHVDHALSQECGHIGFYDYRLPKGGKSAGLGLNRENQGHDVHLRIPRGIQTHSGRTPEEFESAGDDAAIGAARAVQAT